MNTLPLTHRLRHYAARLGQECALRTGLRTGRPTDVILVLTYRCNARCLHCHSYNVPRMRELTGDQWFTVLGELREWLGPVFLSITGGEALLRRDAVDVAARAASLGFRVELLTNGWVVDEVRAARLISSGVRRIKISLDGTREETHDRIRGIAGFYRRSLRALELLAGMNREAGAGIQIYAKTAIMRPNVHEVASVARLAAELGLHGVEFQAIEPVYHSAQQDDPGWYRDNPLWIADASVAHKAVAEIRALKAAGYPVINSEANLRMMEAYFDSPQAEAHRVHSHDYGKSRPDCRAWAAGLQIQPDGGMKMCHWMPSFANAADGGLARAWRTRAACPRCGRP